MMLMCVHVHNEISHGKGMVSVQASVCFLRKDWEELCRVKHKEVTDNKRMNVIGTTATLQVTRRPKAKWKSPEEGWISINVDGAFMQ